MKKSLTHCSLRAHYELVIDSHFQMTCLSAKQRGTVAHGDSCDDKHCRHVAANRFFLIPGTACLLFLKEMSSKSARGETVLLDFLSSACWDLMNLGFYTLRRVSPLPRKELRHRG